MCFVRFMFVSVYMYLYVCLNTIVDLFFLSKAYIRSREKRYQYFFSCNLFIYLKYINFIFLPFCLWAHDCSMVPGVGV